MYKSVFTLTILLELYWQLMYIYYDLLYYVILNLDMNSRYGCKYGCCIRYRLVVNYMNTRLRYKYELLV